MVDSTGPSRVPESFVGFRLCPRRSPRHRPSMVEPAPFDIVLHSPRIALNAGAVGRICAATGAPLHVVRPIPFRLDEPTLRRSGLDYWEFVRLSVHADWAACRESLGARRTWLFSTRGGVAAFEAPFAPGDALLFGNESHGAPEWLHDEVGPERTVVLPMADERARSLNLATAVAAALYLAWSKVRWRAEPRR